ncbi:class I SAM-dependent methyltransferase [Bacteroides sp. AM07-16]|nr:class I SAM-dependent methyltransferase [Bacteroides sp. AM07-16]
MNTIADFFDTIADRWDELCTHDPDKINRILKQTSLHKGMRILDVGCGTGILEQFLLPYSPSMIVAIDISPLMIERAQSKYAVKNVDFRNIDVLDINKEQFNYIIAYSVFPHFEHQQEIIRHLAALLLPEGELVICHSEGRDKINAHHNQHASKLSFGLPSAQELANWMKPYFDIQTIHDTDQYYLVSGKRKL